MIRKSPDQARRPIGRSAPTRAARPKIGLEDSPGARPKIGLALAGGGPLGAIYEIGALCALEEAVPGLDLNALDGYVGVSAGGLVAACLANGMTPRQLCSAFIENSGPRGDVVRPGLFIRPALSEYARRLAALPGLMAMAGFGFAFKGRSVLASLEHLGRALPTGLFSSAPLERQLRSLLAAPGRSNDFRQLERERGRRLGWWPPTSTAAKPRPSACRAGTTCRFPKRQRPAPRCRACFRRCRSMATGTSTVR